jgi:hypothetical protein
MNDFQLKTPVIFIIFNRPDTAAKVFEAIAQAQPPKLLVVADGPRLGRPGEPDRVAAVRALIQDVDWPCEVLCNFSDVNLGCRLRVASGLDWAFQLVPEAIILEDDCLPNLSFFKFCEQMLDHYRLDTRIGMISGNNFQLGHKLIQDSYYFSKYMHIWGWASWRDRWIGSYDVNMRRWPQFGSSGGLTELIPDPKEALFWASLFDRVYRKEIDTWDYQWVFANWISGRLCILPAVNLVSNIGFGADATHTVRDSPFANLEQVPLEFPLTHPKTVLRNEVLDDLTKRNWFMVPLWKKVFRHVSLLIRSLLRRA